MTAETEKKIYEMLDQIPVTEQNRKKMDEVRLAVQMGDYRTAITKIKELNSEDDEKEEIPQPTYFEDIANEHVVSTIENVPGMVYNEYDGYVFISCSEYVDEYLAYPLPNGTNLPATSLPPVDLSIWKVYPKDTTIPYDTNRRSFLLDEVTKDMIGVTAAEFREFDILLGSKVYVSASITNNVKENGSQNHSTKAYLLDLKERQ